MLVSGFIDFIVEPSFQVMGDMLDKITTQLQQKRSDDDDDESPDKINRATNTGSVDSLESSESGSGSARLSDKGKSYVYVACRVITASKAQF